MLTSLRVLTSLALLLSVVESARAEILIRWDQQQVPSPQSLALSTLVVPARNTAAVQHALAQGYRVYLEVEASALAGFIPPRQGLAGVVVKGNAGTTPLLQLRRQLASRGARVLTLDERGKWPHIRTNWVTRNKEVLQVTSRSAQPWIENNAALFRISDAHQLVTYNWTPITLADKDEGPALENYLVAIAEAGSYGADLVLPLHERFQHRLLLGHPQARADWNEIRRSIEFYSWNLHGRYRPIANIGVVTAEPMLSFEVMNLLLRHNLLFDVMVPSELSAQKLAGFDLLVVPDKPVGRHIDTLMGFAQQGGTVVVFVSEEGSFPWRGPSPVLKTADRASYQVGKGRVVEVLKAVADPNAFALEVRQLLGREHRVIDIWNGITVLTASYDEPSGQTVLVTALNYAHQPLPVQIRVRGTFSEVHYESPEEPAALLPYEHREGYTEFVLPTLRIGGRVFLTHKASAK
jgi:hypothetical protein